MGLGPVGSAPPERVAWVAGGGRREAPLGEPGGAGDRDEQSGPVERGDERCVEEFAEEAEQSDTADDRDHKQCAAGEEPFAGSVGAAEAEEACERPGGAGGGAEGGEEAGETDAAQPLPPVLPASRRNSRQKRENESDRTMKHAKLPQQSSERISAVRFVDR